MNVHEALKLMREYTSNNIPFNIGFVSCDTTRNISKGYKEVSNVLLRTGLSTEYDISRLLVSYTELNSNKPKQFYLPLLFKLNDIEIE